MRALPIATEVCSVLKLYDYKKDLRNLTGFICLRISKRRRFLNAVMKIYISQYSGNILISSLKRDVKSPTLYKADTMNISTLKNM